MVRRKQALVRTAISIACLAIPTTFAMPQHAVRPTRVLLLYALAPDSPTAAPLIERLSTTIRSELPPPVEIYIEFLDLDRFPDPKASQRAVRYLGGKYGNLAVDVVIAAGSAALQFATGQLREQLSDVPVVFGMVYGYGVDLRALPSNTTGRLLSMSLGRTLTMARRLQPGLERVFVIAGSAPIDSLTMTDALNSIGPLRDSVQVVVRQGVPFDDLRAELRQLPPRSAVFFANFRRDGRGRVFVPLDAFQTLARESRVPSYGFADPMLMRGILGGAMFQHDDEGVRIGELVVRVLRAPRGTPVPPVEQVESPFIVDWRTLRRFKLDERRLPPGTEVRFRVPSTWERYRDEILTAVGVITAQAILIGLLLVERRARRNAEQALLDQNAYERTMAELTTDAVRHAPEDAPRALEDALARVGSFAGADVAVLVQNADASRPESRVAWSAPGQDAVRSIETDALHLELPLIIASTCVGALELYRFRPCSEWPPELTPRLFAAAEVIAGAIARSRAASATSEAQRQVAHLGRVAIVGELGSTISHELRQPLTAIRVNAESGMKMLDTSPDIDETRQLLQDIVADAARASATIEQIRLMLRLQAPETTPVDLNDVCTHVGALLRHDAVSRGVRLNLALTAGLPPVHGNEVELQQTILNLALNGFDAVDAVSGPRTVEIATAASNGSVELFVRDTGLGLSAEVRPRLFQPFFTTKEHGLGMGLAIVRTLVEQHGGRIAAENNIDGGATFRVILPTAVQSPNGASQDVVLAGV